jgi:hypothetical protein
VCRVPLCVVFQAHKVREVNGQKSNNTFMTSEREELRDGTECYIEGRYVQQMLDISLNNSLLNWQIRGRFESAWVFLIRGCVSKTVVM